METDLEQLRTDYRRDGFVIVRGLFEPPIMERIAGASERLAKDPRLFRPDNLRAQMRTDAEGRQVVDRLDPVADLDPCLAGAVAYSALNVVVEALVGEPVIAFKDKLIWKEAGVSGYELHQDYTFWLQVGAEPETMLTAAIAVDSADAENGAMLVYPGLHHRHHLPDKEPERIFTTGSGVLPRQVVAGSEPVRADLAPGDVLIFHSLAPHESGPNRSERGRRVLMVSFCAARYGDIRGRYYESFRACLRTERGDPGYL